MLYIHMTVRYPSQRHGRKIKFDSSHIAESIRGTIRSIIVTDDDTSCDGRNGTEVKRKPKKQKQALQTGNVGAQKSKSQSITLGIV